MANCLEITRVSGNDQWARQLVSGLTLGQAYNGSVYIKAGTSGYGPNGYARFMFVDDSWSELYNTGDFTITANWVKYSLNFTPVSYTAFWYYLLKDNPEVGTMLFDIASLKAVGSDIERISNGSFEVNTTGWTAYQCTLASVAGGVQLWIPKVIMVD